MYEKSDAYIQKALGKRLKEARLRQNKTQKQLAESTQLSLNTIKAIEVGNAKLSTLIAVLRELGALEGLNAIAPESPASPLQLLEMNGKERERATGSRGQ